MQPNFVHQRLSFRMTFGLLLALLVVGVPFFYFFNRFHEHQVIESLRKSSSDLSHFILTDLERGMLEAEPHLLEHDVAQLSVRSAATGIMLLSMKGEVKVSSQQRMTGRIFSKSDPVCRACHHDSSTRPHQTTIIDQSSGSQVFRSVMLIDNRPPCFRCHSPDQRVNGMLIVDLPLTPAEAQLRSGTQKLLGLAAVMVIVTILSLRRMLNRLILDRIKALWETTVAIRSGNLNERVQVKGNDELSELAESFNMMTASLKESLREVQRHKEYLESVINSIEDEIVVVDRHLRIVTANAAYLTRCSHRKEELIGQHCFMATHDGMVACHQPQLETCPAKATFQSQTVEKRLQRFIDREGNEKYVEIHCYPLRDETGDVFQAIEVRRDITERRYLEANLSHSERLASLGLLASGISHEINNPLASIIACTQGLERRASANQESQGSSQEILEYLELIRREAMRAKAITDRLLVLSRKSESPTYLISLNQSLSETVSLLRFQAQEKGVEILEELDPQTPAIKADDPALRQVFLNILLNALEATNRDDWIMVRTKTEDSNITIIIEDTGAGIPREDLDRIFEPFFSRKNSTHGTGLGLFISNLLIQQMGGSITVQSELGKGSRFVITLPSDGSPGRAEARGFKREADNRDEYSNDPYA